MLLKSKPTGKMPTFLDIKKMLNHASAVTYFLPAEEKTKLLLR